MDNLKKSDIQSVEKPYLIQRFPFNGRSKYLMDRFYIIGYRPDQLHKILFKDVQIKKSMQNMAKKITQEEALNPSSFNKSPLNPNFSKNPNMKIILEESPSLLNEISSDMRKELPDFDLIKSMLFPNKLSVFVKPEFIKKNIINRSNTISENLIFQKQSSCPTKFDEDSNPNNKSFSFDDEENNNGSLKLMNSKQYNMVFSYNPQSGKNSKKSINGFAYVFFKEFSEKQEIGGIKFTFYVPVTFCIISEFPFFNSYYRLCRQIIQLFQNNKNEIPLEILLYNIINFCPSPLNGEVILNIEPTKFPSEKTVINSSLRISQEKKKEINIIKEEDEFYNDDIDNPFDLDEKDLGNKINEKEKYAKKISDSPLLKSKMSIGQKKDFKNILKKHGSKFLGENKNISPDFIKPKKKSKVNFGLNPRNTIGMKINHHKFLNLDEDLDEMISNKNSSHLYSHDDIKFQFLSGYPLIQYNLSKILLYKLSPQDVIIIFFYSFLEKDILFFSKSIEYLSLTINSYLNLNFPLNDEKYYFFNACVSYDNFINDNSPFVGATFTSILGINSSYKDDYLSKTKLKEHLAVDLDKGVIYMNEDPNDKDKNMKNKTFFDYIKKICKKELDDNGNILEREVKILYEKLEACKNDNSTNSNFYRSTFSTLSSRHMINIDSLNNSNNNFIDYDDRGQNCIKNKNRNIQEGFYRLINNICLYFYQNLSLKSDDDKEDLNKIIINRKNKGLNTDADTMNIIFHKDYETGENNYTKEEIFLLDELMETMKFESFVYGFIQSYNPIDLYKIPLTMTEEFISILSRKNSVKNQNINFFSLFDNIYKKKGLEKMYVDFNPFSSEYYKKIKKYFDREIYDENTDFNSTKKNVKNKFLKPKLSLKNEGKIIENLKYSDYILDNHLILKYMRFLKNIKKDDYYHMFHLASSLEQNKLKFISITDIENEIEICLNNLDILSKRDICCSNIILLFILSIKTIKNYIDCQPFLSAFFQNFNVFRKYYTMIMNIIYRLMNECLEKKDYINAKNYFFCYYSCINSLRSLKLVPNENLMNTISKFDKIDYDDLLEKFNNCINKEEGNQEAKELMNQFNTGNKNIYVIYNFMKNAFVKEKNIIEIVSELKGPQNLKLKIGNKEEKIEKIIEPKIRFSNGSFKYECLIYTQDKILEDLNKQYAIYSKNLDEFNLDNKILFEACLNIVLFTRNTNFFSNNDDLIDNFKIIFNVYLYKMINMIKYTNNNEDKK